MDLSDMDEGDLLSRVLEQAAEAAAPEARRLSPVAPRTVETRTWTLPGILGSTRVATNFGHVPAHLVRVGDSLRTRDGGFERVRRIREVKIDSDFLTRRPDAAPVIIRRNALPAGMPHQDVGFSAGQMVGVGENRFEDRLVPAEEISRERGGIDAALGMLVYIRFQLDRAAQISCDGIWADADTE